MSIKKARKMLEDKLKKSKFMVENPNRWPNENMCEYYRGKACAYTISLKILDAVGASCEKLNQQYNI